MNIVPYIPSHSLADMQNFVESNETFYLFGAGEEGESYARWLRNRGKKVIAFIDNQAAIQGIIYEGLEIISLEKVVNKDSRIIITSIHSDLISLQLEDHGFKFLEHYIVYDNLMWIDYAHFSHNVGAPFYNTIKDIKDEFIKVYNLLSDDYSKEVYSKVINYRLTVFAPSVRKKDYLPIPLDSYYSLKKSRNTKKEQLHNELKEKYPMDKIKTIARNVANNLYSYNNYLKMDNYSVILDIGGYDGETAVGFSYNSRDAKVYSFEPSQVGIEKINQWTKLFPNIRVIGKGVWHENSILSFNEGEEQSQSSRVGEGEKKIEVISIDWFVQQEKIQKVDFIKMDIEGAELNGLRGAMQVIERDMPDLVISIYHSPSDLWEIPMWIKTNFPAYNIFIDHPEGMNVWGTLCIATLK